MIQQPLFKPQTEWIPPESFPDFSKYDEIAIDLETKDPDLTKMGSGSVVGRGDSCRNSCSSEKTGALVITQLHMRVVVTWIVKKY